MQAILDQLTPYLVGLVSTILVALVSSATLALRKKLNSDRANAILDRFDALAADVVLEAEQTVVARLKSASASGTKLSRTDASDIADTVLDKLKSHVGPQGAAEAMKVLGIDRNQLNSMLSSKIEASVYELKNASAAGSQGVSP